MGFFGKVKEAFKGDDATRDMTYVRVSSVGSICTV